MTGLDPIDSWPPEFSLDQEQILNLLTGDRFYSNASAALREAVLNAVDAVQRRRANEPDLTPEITVTFDHDDLSLCVSDNGDGMDRSAVSELFTRVGASASKLDATGAVGEFGIGVISYFMASDSFSVQTYDGSSEPIGLKFSRGMLAHGAAEPMSPTQDRRGTTIKLDVQNPEIFSLLVTSYPEWCRDVNGLTAFEQPGDIPLHQGGTHRPNSIPGLSTPEWVERAHLAPVSEPKGWDAMSGTSTISVLYRGVFVQDYTAKKLWGIEGSIDVDPKHFKPRLNREGFVHGPFQEEVNGFLIQSHPAILKAMAGRLNEAFLHGSLDKWAARKWATLWLSVPRGAGYAEAAAAWDAIFRQIPAFELAVKDKWEAISLEQLLALERPFYVAPLRENKHTEVVKAALRLLRHTKRTVIRGLQADRQWLREAGNSFSTTADLISNVFANELMQLQKLESHAEGILQQVTPVATLFGGKPSVELVRIGNESPSILRISSRLIINLDHPKGRAIVDEVLTANSDRWSLISIAARHSHQHIPEVAASIRESSAGIERLGLVRRRFIRGLLS
jgi:hypothetical protein